MTEGESPITVDRRDGFVSNILSSIFVKSNDPVLIHTVHKDKTGSELLYRKLSQIYCQGNTKTRKLSGTKGIKSLQNNTQSRTYSDVIHYLTREGIIISMPHPPYSPDLAPCHYWLNDDIKLINQMKNHWLMQYPRRSKIFQKNF